MVVSGGGGEWSVCYGVLCFTFILICFHFDLFYFHLSIYLYTYLIIPFKTFIHKRTDLKKEEDLFFSFNYSQQRLGKYIDVR